MISYTLVLLFSVLFLIVTKYSKHNNIALTIVYIIIISLLSSFRELSVPDTVGYINFYQSLTNNFNESIKSTYMESGFVIFSNIISVFFGGAYKYYFFLISVSNLILILLGIRNFLLNKNDTIDYTTCLIVYMLTFGYSFNFIILRAGLAFSLFFYSISIYRKSWKKALFIYLLSILFHSSMLIMIMTVPFLLSKKNKRRVPYFIFSILISFLIWIGYSGISTNLFFIIANKIPLISLRFKSYISPEIVNRNIMSLVGIYIYIIQGFLLVKSKSKNDYVVKSYLLGLIIWALFINLEIVGRIVTFFLAPAFIVSKDYAVLSSQKIINKLILFFCLSYILISNYRLLLFHISG